MKWNDVRDHFRNHGTKWLGFASTTFGALATSGDFFSVKTLKLFIMLSGLLTAWRGFVNSRNQSDGT